MNRAVWRGVQSRSARRALCPLVALAAFALLVASPAAGRVGAPAAKPKPPAELTLTLDEIAETTDDLDHLLGGSAAPTIMTGVAACRAGKPVPRARPYLVQALRVIADGLKEDQVEAARELRELPKRITHVGFVWEDWGYYLSVGDRVVDALRKVYSAYRGGVTDVKSARIDLPKLECEEAAQHEADLRSSLQEANEHWKEVASLLREAGIRL